MRLRVDTDKNNQWMHKLDGDGKIISTRPATNEEVWLYGEIDSLITENNQMENRIAEAESLLTQSEQDVERLGAENEDWARLNREQAAEIAELKGKVNRVF